MQNQNLSCPICTCDYNLDENVPKNLPTCGHTICAKCLQNTFHYNKLQCPFDKSKFPHGLTRDSFTTNYALLDLIGENSIWEICQLHNKRLELMCSEDKQKLCSECALFGNHKGHDITQIIDKKPIIEKNTNLLTNLLKDFQKNSDTLQKVTLEHKILIKNLITRQFQEMITFLQETQREIMNEFETFFSKAQNYIQSESSEDHLKKQIGDKIKDYQNFTKSKNFVQIIQEDLTDIQDQAEKKLASGSLQIKNWDKALNQLESDLKNAFDTNLTSLYHLNFPKNQIFNTLHSLEMINQEKDSSARKKNSVDLDLKTSFSFIFRNKNLQIISDQLQPKKIRIKAENLDKVDGIDIDLELFDFNQDDVKALKSIWQAFEKNVSIKIKATSQASLTKNALLEVFKIIFSKPKYLNYIEIDFSWNQHADHCLDYFSDHILPKLHRLESISLILNDSEFEDQSIQKLAQGILPHMGTIKTFILDLASLPLSEKVFPLLFQKLPALESLKLCFDNTNLDDIGAQILIEKSLTSAQSLHTLELSFWRTAITDKSVSNLLKNIKCLQKLTLNLQSTDISDQCFQEFIQSKKCVQNIEIDISNTRVSKTMKSQIDKFIKHS